MILVNFNTGGRIMKTIFKFIAALSLALTFAACQKESSFVDPAQNGKTISLTVCDNITRTAYTPGTGVALTGSEPIGLFYRNGEGRWNGMAVTGQAKPVIATPSDGAYTFTIPEGAEYTEWTGIMPYSSQNSFTDTQGIQMVVKLSSVQCPGQNTFDPAYDYLLAKNFVINEGEGTAEITEFKRIFAPLRLTLKGISADEKIYAVTFASNQSPYVPDEGEWPFLVGQFNVNCSGEASQAKIVSVEYQKNGDIATGNIAFGNAVSAVYDGGLSCDASGQFPVWFMVNPSFVFNADSKVTVTVNTSAGQVVRTVTLPEELALETDKLNGITVDMSGAGAVADSHVVLTQVYNNVTKLADARASDGNKYNWANAALWNVNDNNRDAGSLLKNALNFTGRTATIPAVSGYKVEKVRLYAHIVTNAKYATASALTLTYGEGQTVVYPYNFCTTDTEAPVSLYTNGGVVDIVCPDGVDNLAGLTLTGANNCLASAVAFYLVEDRKEYEEATGNDLWAEWNAGKKITINGVAYTKDDYPAADLVNVTTNFADAQKGGVHFLEGTYSTGGAGNHINFTNSIVWIGRYQDNKPTVEAGQFKLSGADYVFRNMNLSGLNTNNMFPNNNSVSANTNLVVSSCVVNAKGGIVRDVNATYSFESIVFESSIVSYKANNFYFTNGKTASSAKSKLFKVVGCTVNNNGLTGALYNINQNAFVQSDVDVVITGNTLTLGCEKLVNSSAYKSLTVSDNTGYDGPIE